MKASITAILSAALLSSPALAADSYCLAIRGNGENVAAHWPALARLVEENGMPSATSGGSSATVSMFLLDSLAGNPALNAEKDEAKRRKMQAVLLKSLPEFVTEMAKHDKLLDVYGLMRELKDQNSTTVSRILGGLSKPGALSTGDMAKMFQKYAPLVNPDLVRGLGTNQPFFREEAKNAVKVFGQFDAKEPNLFVRPGVVDFKYFSVILGSVADFYAGNTDAATAKELSDFANDCAESTYRKAWKDAPASDCQKRFQGIVRTYLSRGQFQHKALFQSAGTNVKSYPSTSVVKGEAARQLKSLNEAYAKGDASAAYGDFSVDYKKGELAFGYWGSDADLKKIDKGLETYRRQGDEKSKRFQAMGPGNWFEVLATSPAEPGLASAQAIPTGTTRAQVLAELKRPITERWQGLNYRKDEYSAGGWADLHPTGLLRASGCERVAYLTRKDGDAVFGQQIFIRLSGSKGDIPFWEKLGEKNNDGYKVDGTKAANTPWNKLYNLGNRDSSFNRALGLADAVYCTDWNRYKVFHGEMDAMVDEAYASPVFLRGNAPKTLQVNPGKPGSYPGCAPQRGRSEASVDSPAQAKPAN